MIQRLRPTSRAQPGEIRATIISTRSASESAPKRLQSAIKRHLQQKLRFLPICHPERRRGVCAGVKGLVFRLPKSRQDTEAIGTRGRKLSLEFPLLLEASQFPALLIRPLGDVHLRFFPVPNREQSSFHALGYVRVGMRWDPDI